MAFRQIMNFQPKFDSSPLLSEPLPPPPPKRDPRQTNSLILRLSLIGFITALASRATDPVIPQIAHDIQVDPNAVALLTTAFALPFALSQPVIGPVGDMVGKVRVMIACLAVTILAMLASGLATDFSILLGARIVAGIAAGGIFPVGIAVIGDLVPVQERQIAIGRWLTAVITGNLLGSSLAGVIGDLTGWRGVFFAITALGLLAIVVAIVTLRQAARVKPAGLSLSGFSAGYGSVFANPRAKVCFGAVFAEGVIVFGLFPFVALLLHAAGETRATIAGAIIAGFSLGGVVYAVAVPMLVARWRPDQLMIGGGGLAALALAIVAFNLPWPVQFAAFTLLGFGFYSMHGSIQVQATELSSSARGAAMSLHSFFFFAGHASGPVLYGLAFVKFGSVTTLGLAALIAAAIGLVTARLLRERTGTHET